MKNFINKLFLLLPAIIILASSTQKNNDARSLYAELDKKAPLNTLTATEKQAGWKLLFDGKNTTGWHGFNLTSSQPPDQE